MKLSTITTISMAATCLASATPDSSTPAEPPPDHCTPPHHSKYFLLVAQGYNSSYTRYNNKAISIGYSEAFPGRLPFFTAGQNQPAAKFRINKKSELIVKDHAENYVELEALDPQQGWGAMTEHSQGNGTAGWYVTYSDCYLSNAQIEVGYLPVFYRICDWNWGQPQLFYNNPISGGMQFTVPSSCDLVNLKVTYREP